jgi:hypothetical protein
MLFLNFPHSLLDQLLIEYQYPAEDFPPRVNVELAEAFAELRGLVD